MSNPTTHNLSKAWKRTATVASIIIIAFLALAIVGKIATPNPRKTVDLLGSSIKLDYLIAAGEIIFIAALARLARKRIAWAAVTLMFGGFTGYAGYYLFLHDGSCGCFGSLIDLPVWTPFAVDIFAVLAGTTLLLWAGTKPPKLAALLLAAGLLSGVGFTVAQQTAPPTAAEIEREAAEKLAAELEEDADKQTQTDTPSTEDPNTDSDSQADQAPELTEAQARRQARINALGTRASAPERLIRADTFADIMSQPDAGPAWLVFIYDPDCEVCMAVKPDFDDWQPLLEEEQNERLRIRQVSKAEAEADAGIEYYAWRGSPVLFIVTDGVVTHRWLDDNTPSPEDVLLGLELGDLAPNFP